MYRNVKQVKVSVTDPDMGEGRWEIQEIGQEPVAYKAFRKTIRPMHISWRDRVTLEKGKAH